MDIEFLPKVNDKRFEEACKEYSSLWLENKKSIIHFIQEYSCLKFKSKNIIALISNEPSRSHPLTLRFNYAKEIKIGTLIHELTHIIFTDNKIRVSEVTDENISLTVHKFLNLILYDIWASVFDKEFADQNIIVESERTSMYKIAWDYALGMNKQDREKEYKSLLLLYS